MSTTSNMQKMGAATLSTSQTLPASTRTNQNVNDKKIALFTVALYLIWGYGLLNPSNVFAKVMDYFHNTSYEHRDMTGCASTLLGLLTLVLIVGLYFDFDMNKFRNCADPVRVPVRPIVSSNTHVAKDGQAPTKVEVVEAVRHETPSKPVTPTPAPRPQYPPPLPFPFEHFRATGQSFARHNFNEPWGPSPIPRTYPRRDSLYTKADVPTVVVACEPTQDNRMSNKETSSGPEYVQDTVKNSTVPVMDIVVVTPDHKVVKKPVQIAPATIHTPAALAVTNSPGPEIVQAPSAPTPHPEIVQVGLPTVSPSIIDRQIGMLDLVAAQEYKIKSKMEALFVAFATNGAYEAPALLILSMMEEAKTHLLPLFPNGLTGLNPDRLIWANSLVTFWDALRPHGYEIQAHPDESIRIFMVRYHDFAHWLGLGHLLLPFIVTAPPAPEPIQAPPRSSSSSSSRPRPPPRIIIQYPTPTVSFEAPAHAAPEAPQPAPTPSAPTQEQPVQQPQAAPRPPALLNFDANDWLDQSDEALNALTWQSFGWSSHDQGRYKIWSYSTMGRLHLPQTDPSLLTPEVVKAEFEKVAPAFKRACVVLRLQARNCRCPDEDVVGTLPLFGEVLGLLLQAEKMTNDCAKVVAWDAFDKWYVSCLYFRDAVRLDAAVWERLKKYYESDRYTPMMRVWKDMKAEWVGDVDEE